MKTDERGPETAPRRAGLTRRAAIACSVAGCAGLAGAASWFSFLRKAVDDATPADIFKGDAPNARVWEAWRQRHPKREPDRDD